MGSTQITITIGTTVITGIVGDKTFSIQDIPFGDGGETFDVEYTNEIPDWAMPSD